MFYARDAHRGVEGSLHSSTIFDVNPFTRTGLTFIDAEEEREYVEKELRPLLRTRIPKVSLILAGTCGVGLIGEAVLADELMRAETWLLAVPCVAWLLLAAVVLVRPLLSANVLQACSLLALCVHGLLINAPRAELFFGSREIGTLAGCFGCLLASIFIPTTPIFTAVGVVAACLGAALGQLLWHADVLEPRLVALQLMLVVGGVLGVGVFTRWYMYVAHRRFFHWARSVRIEHKRTLAARINAEQLSAEQMAHRHQVRARAPDASASGLPVLSVGVQPRGRALRPHLPRAR